MTIWTKTKARYERQPRYSNKLHRWHFCQYCGGPVIAIETGYKSRCLKCGPVTCVSMLETDANLFKAFFAQLAAQ